MLYLIGKRLFDLFVSITIWIIASPFMLFFSLIIKLTSKGPIFVTESIRISHFKPFFMYKFRTMKLNADKELENTHPQLKKMLHHDHKIPLNQDPRITRFGKFLRKTDLDELPQIINIILGNMSLIGPRPYLKWEIDQVLKDSDPIAKENLKKIQEIKPGLTNLWFISGRNNVKFKQRLELDALYARNRNFFLDMKILFKTPQVLITGKGRI